MKPGARELIIESAATKFAEFGIDRVSLDEIAHAANVHRSTLHRHFPEGRDALVVATLDREAERAAARLVEVADAAPNAADALSDELTELVTLSRGNQILRLLLAQDAGKQAVLTSATTRFRTLAGQHWLRLAKRARAEGFNVTSAPVDAVIAHVLRITLSLLVDPGELQAPADVRSYAEAFITPALISTPAPQPRRRS